MFPEYCFRKGESFCYETAVYLRTLKSSKLGDIVSCLSEEQCNLIGCLFLASVTQTILKTKLGESSRVIISQKWDIICWMIKNDKCLSMICSSAIDCELSQWADWQECSATCGKKSVQVRRRKVLQKAKHGGIPCAARREKRFCSLPMCPNEDVWV